MPGIANGLAVMRDEETSSLWDHITGECFDGSLAGERLTFWGVALTTASAERTNYPNTILLKSDYRSPVKSLMGRVIHRTMNIQEDGTKLMPHFRASMSSDIDPRLPEGKQGLGVMDDLNGGKFYPMDAIEKGGFVEDVWLGRKLRIERGSLDGIPFATWTDTGEAPMQLLTRWYGFSFTYPNCEIYQPRENRL